MNSSVHPLRAIALFSLLLLSGVSFAAGLMKPANAPQDTLAIKQHHVNVVIEDGYATTYIDQVFHNHSDQELEAIYSFPVPEKASVGEFTYWIDGKPVTGEVLKKQRAREIYESEKAAGRETALTEKDEYRRFESRVYPVRAKQDVKIRLVYIQAAHIDSGIGRYVYPLEEGGVDTEQQAFWHYDDVVTEAFSFNLHLRSSYPIDGLRLPKHPHATITSQSSHIWQVALTNGQSALPDDDQVLPKHPKQHQTTDVQANTNAVKSSENSEAGASQQNPQAAPSPSVIKLDKDIVVYWRHQQGLPGSIDMVAHKEAGSSKGTFMMTITPGDDLNKIQQGRDWVFVLDLSGSMQGKYHSLTEGVKLGLNKLNPNDRFKVILFNNNARELTRGYTPATPQNVTDITRAIAQTQPNGGTNLYAGLREALVSLDADRASAIVLVTDGVANVGVTEKKQFLTLLEKRDVRLFTFVMGNSANKPLLNGMAKISNGFAMAVSNSDDIAGRLMLATDKLSHQALNNIQLTIDGVKTKNLSPEHIGSLYRGQQLIVFGHYFGDGPANVSLSGNINGLKKTYQTQFEFPAIATRNPEIERLWAYANIEHLEQKMDYLGADADTEQAITDIAIQYGLVTNYTSMLVVREEVFQQLNINRSNQQRTQKEAQARQQRQAAPVHDNRQDTQQPAFDKPRAYPKRSSGGGASTPVILFLMLTVLFYPARHRKSNAHK